MSRSISNQPMLTPPCPLLQCWCSLDRPNVSSDPSHDGCIDVCAGSTDGEICGGYQNILRLSPFVVLCRTLVCSFYACSLFYYSPAN